MNSFQKMIRHNESDLSLNPDDKDKKAASFLKRLWCGRGDSNSHAR